MAVTIALADDHQLVRKGIRLLLENIDDFKVTVDVANGKELIDSIDSTGTLPDLVLVDVNMPVMSGQETVTYLRAKYRDLKIIALSVNDQVPIIKEMIALGANAYLYKDSSPETFQKVLLEVYNKGFYYDQSVVESLLTDTSSNNYKPKSELQNMLVGITSREMLFMNHCCSELTYKEIAQLMGVSQRTVDGYRENLFDKLNVKSRTGLVLFAVQAGVFSMKK